MEFFTLYEKPLDPDMAKLVPYFYNLEHVFETEQYELTMYINGSQETFTSASVEGAIEEFYEAISEDNEDIY